MSHAMPSGEAALQRLLATRPDERERLLPYVDKAKGLAGECGCAMAGAFLTAALIMVVVYALAFDGLSPNFIADALLGAGFVFSAGVIGKLVGMGIARARLALLYLDLRRRFPLAGA
jgi:hypothetical protein